MLDIEKLIYKGFVKIFNGQFGFLTSEHGDTFFHKSGILGYTNIEKGDEVEFKVAPSNKKKGSFQAIDIVFLKRLERPLIILEKPITGILKWFNAKKGYGIIETLENVEYFLHKSNMLIETMTPMTGDLVIFEEKIEKGKKSAIHCKVADQSQQRTILNKYLKVIGNIDNKEKFDRVKYFLENSKMDKETMEEFLISVYNQCDVERKFNMWFEGLAQEKNLHNIAQQITQVSISSYSNPFAKIFEKLSDSIEQETVLNKFLEFIGSIENEEKYNRLKSLASCPTIDKKVREEFLISVYNQCDVERKFNMWLEGLTQEKNLHNIAQQITQVSISSYSNPFAKIFEKLSDSIEQETVLNKFLEFIGSIENEGKYNKSKSLASCPTIDKKVREEFLISVFKNCDAERKFKLWVDGLSQEKDLHFIAQQITLESIDLYQIFKKLLDTNEQEIVLSAFFKIIGDIDSKEKYNRIKSLTGCSALDEKLKVKFQLLKLIESNIHYQVERFLASWQFNEEDIEQQIINLFTRLDIISVYSFCLELIHPLAKINTHYKYNGYSYLKIYLENRDYIEETNNKYGNASIFCLNGTLLKDIHFETKIKYFKIISTYIKNHYSILEGNAKAIIDSDKFKIISKYLKVFQAYYSSHVRICTDLLIDSIKFPDIESYIIQKCNTSQLLRLWVHSLIDYFNFNNYCFYYFTLTLGCCLFPSWNFLK